jgi:hypothetical protein
MFFASKANFVIDNVHNGQEKNPSLINELLKVCDLQQSTIKHYL